MLKRNKYLVDIYRIKEVYDGVPHTEIIRFRILVHENLKPNIRLVIDLGSHVFRKRLSKKHIETIMDSKEAPKITKSTSYSTTSSVWLNKKISYDKIKTYEIP